MSRTTTTPLEATTISIICFGLFIWSSLQAMLTTSTSVADAATPAAFSDDVFVGIIVTELILAGIALFTLRARGYAIATLYPAPSWPGVAVAIGLYAAITLINSVVQMPFSADSADSPIIGMLSNSSVSLQAIIPTAVINGIYEEVFLLGFLLRGLRSYGLSIAVGIPLLIRVLYHTYQGPMGVVSVLIFGVVLSAYYVRSQSLFTVVFVHILGDIIPFVWQ